MLEYLRNASEKPVAKVLIALLAFSFVGWGVAEWIFGGVVNDTTLVTVGDSEISLQQFNMEKSRELAKMSRDEQRAFYTDPAAAQKMNQDVILRLATQQMAQNRAEDLGFVVSDARIAREIREYPEFQQNGQFSTLLFDSVLRNSGYSEADFANVLRGSVMRSMALGAAGAPIAQSKFVSDATYNARYGQREIDFATVNFKDFKVGAPTDVQLREFYATRPHTVAEHRSASYVLIPSDDMTKPDEFDAAYKIAQAVEDDIISGETMADAAKKHKVKFTALKSFELSKRPVDENLSDAMIVRIFDMEQGLESELIETKEGFLILRVDEIVPQHTAEFDAVKDTLVDAWKSEQQKKQAYVRANELLVDLNQGGKLAGKKSATVSRAKGAPVEVLSAAFASETGNNSIVPAADAFYVLSVKSEIPAKADAKKMTDLNKEMSESMQRILMDDYNSFLMRQYPVEVNQKVYERFISK